MEKGTAISNKRQEEEEQIKEACLNPEKFRVLYEFHFKSIFLFVLKRVGGKEQTADITSQVFLKAFVNLEKYRFTGAPFSSWLYRIAINECNEYFRRSHTEQQVLLNNTFAEELYVDMFNEDTLEELRAKLPYILEKLETEEFQLIELRFLEGMSFREVSEILDITESYARVRTYRVLDKLRKLFLKTP